ncbi:ABC transporter permease [Nocardioides ungokensis]|uniref:ABC transporter permease n=1 Tax=Nocardioides ungokensis TaxID=1643322 RepID=UPI0015DFEBD6|nr:ABC transporter permease [Nocardioides ungokensis]
MTATSTLPTTAPVKAGTPGRPGLGATIRWELRKLRAQHRTKAVLLGALLGPVPIALVIHAQGRPPKDTLFGRYATTNGFALSLLILGFAAQWVLPLLIAVVAGDIFSSEDTHGTWKTVLTRSASRAQLFTAKTVTAVGFAVLTLLVLSASTIASSVLVGGHQALTGLGGQLIAPSTALKLVGASWLTTIPPTIGFACLAILLSVWSRSSAVGIAAPVVIGMVMQLVGAMGGVEALRPFLLTTPYEAWHGLLSAPRFTGPLVEGLLTTGAWAAVTLAVSFALLRRRDITGG